MKRIKATTKMRPYSIMKPYAITEPSKTWSGFKNGEKVIGYQDRNKHYFWWKSKKSALKYAKSHSEKPFLYYATLQDYNEATIYNICLNAF